MADDTPTEKKEAGPKKGWAKSVSKDTGEEEKTKKGRAPSVKDQENPDFKYIVRLANTDLDGKYQVIPALAQVKGLGLRTAAVVATKSGVNAYQKIGDLKDDQVQKLQDAIDGLQENLPVWMLNRRKDVETGEDGHLIGTDIESRLRDDLNRLKKIRTFRGLRHESGQKVRGQRSRSNGRTGLTLGVMKQKVAQPTSDKKE